MRIGVISDLHLYNKTVDIKLALAKLYGSDLILIAGDIADRADVSQYDILLNLIDERFHDIPLYCVSGNHDNPARDDTNYRQFENKINSDYPSVVDACGAFYKCINEHIDIVGLNPLYHQKQFFFSDRGKQLSFLQDKFNTSPCKIHIVMCHPPLLAHNPQRTADMAPYITGEQDTRLQKIIDGCKNVVFLSGHTHVAPTIEFDEIHSNLYINDGSICPTVIKNTSNKTQQGNVTLLDISETKISVVIKDIHGGKIISEEHITTESG